MKKRKTIALCSSVTFYKELLEIENQLKKIGVKVLVPKTAKIMQKSGNFDETFYKTWYKDESDYDKKKSLMDGHFRKIKQSDTILVINLEKKGIKGYIGGNVLMEMTLAYILKQPIYLWNAIDETHPFLEEIKGMGAIIINQDLSSISLK